MSAEPNTQAAGERLQACADLMWERMQIREPYYRMRAGSQVERLLKGSLEEAERDSALCARMLNDLNAIDRSALPRCDQVTAGFLAHLAAEGSHAAIEWWDAFPVTPYMAITGYGMPLQHVLLPFAFSTPSDFDRYLSLLSDYAETLAAAGDKLALMATRGWRIPRPALEGARTSILGFRGMASKGLLPLADRVQPGLAAPAGWRTAVVSLVDQHIVPAFDRLYEMLGEDYGRAARDAIGMVHLPGGGEAYDRAVRRHLTEAVDATVLHRMGLDEVERLSEALAELRAAQGWEQSEQDFHARLRRSPSSYAATPEALGARYRSYIERMQGALPRLFEKYPAAPFEIRRLPPEAEAGMTYGYYHAPTSPGRAGVYFYNGSALDQRLQIGAAALILHELVPGHHFQISRQVESGHLSQLRREVVEFSVFNEGWAEYASSLGGEAGVYDDPIDLYGRYLHERFLAQRMVVDTGLNAFGWTLEKATAYMRVHTLLDEDQIRMELLRYGTDWPGQSLAYHYGYQRFRSLRAQYEKRPDFDIRRFHEAILSEGSLPLKVVDQNIAAAYVKPAKIGVDLY